MFKLQRLEITGFKSFADYTEIVFTGNGITVNALNGDNLAEVHAASPTMRTSGISSTPCMSYTLRCTSRISDSMSAAKCRRRWNRNRRATDNPLPLAASHNRDRRSVPLGNRCVWPFRRPPRLPRGLIPRLLLKLIFCQLCAQVNRRAPKFFNPTDGIEAESVSVFKILRPFRQNLATADA